MLGTPYSWGGGGPGGASRGFAQGAGIVGFDCSSLVQYALSKAGIKAPRIAADQATLGTRAPVGSLAPGDLVVRNDGGHIGIYIGNGRMIEAPHTGDVVKVAPVGKDMFGVHLNIAGTGDFTPPNVATGTIEGPPDEQAPPGVEAPQPLMNFPGIA